MLLCCMLLCFLIEYCTLDINSIGIVLKRQNFGEADRILKILTQELGLITAIAKGCRKVKSKRAGCFELFTEANFQLHRRTGELFLVTNATKVQSFDWLDLGALKKIYLAVEWLFTLVPPEKSVPDIYQLLIEYLIVLKRQKKITLLNVAFKTKLLTQLGFLPDPDSFGEDIRKVIKFFVNSDFRKIVQLIEDQEVLAEIDKILETVFRRETDKVSRVEVATRGWK